MIPANRHGSAILIWGVWQLCLLGIGVSGISIWAHHPVPHDSLALPIMLGGQAIFAALLFPFLAQGLRTASICVVLMLPLDELAAICSNAQQNTVLIGLAQSSLWVSGLLAWGLYLNGNRLKILVSTFASMICLGGVIVDYLRYEANAQNRDSNADLSLSLLFRLCRGGEITPFGIWLQLCAPLLILVLVAGFRHWLQQSKSTLHFVPPR